MSLLTCRITVRTIPCVIDYTNVDLKYEQDGLRPDQKQFSNMSLIPRTKHNPPCKIQIFLKLQPLRHRRQGNLERMMPSPSYQTNRRLSECTIACDLMLTVCVRSDGILQDILDTMCESDIFERTRKDAPSRFWSTYERVAKQHDDEFIERHNSDLDVLLIFVRAPFFALTLTQFKRIVQAGLFSAVSSAFIVNMESSLSPIASDTTNALLMILINTINSTTFPAQQAVLPVWNGPNPTTIWIQTLAYTSLSSSLLAAFGAVLGKQWLGHFKTSRFGRGALHERCQRRQKKLDALETWYFSTIISTLPVFLQMSLLFFGIALAGNIWTLQHTVASVIMATTAFGFIFYFFTVVSSLKSPDCPFQTPVSTMLQHTASTLAIVRQVIRQKWKEHPRSWEDFLNVLRKCSRCVLRTARDLIAKLTWPCLAYLSRISMPSILRQGRPSATDSEAAIGLEQLGTARGHPLPPDMWDLSLVLSDAELAHVDLVPSRAVRWVIETSTDTDVIAAAAGMVSEVEWPANNNVPWMLMDRLKSGFYACFDPHRKILPLAQGGAVACLKAMSRLCVKQDLVNLFYIFANGDIRFKHDFQEWHMVQDDPAFLVVYSAANQLPDDLDITRLPLSELMWMAHMFIHRLHTGRHDPEFDAVVVKFIGTCIDSEPPALLAADCVLLSGMLLGLPIDRQHLMRLDKR
jgi:Family of unknown function (DUF6535)